MKIISLSLENFKSFKQKQTIPFSDLTLLFGPNSVGKSTILLALFYLQEVLRNSNCNPQRIPALGNKQVGGFEKLVHGKDLENEITIGIEYDKQGMIGKDYCKTIPMLEEIAPLGNFINLQDIAEQTETVLLEFKIAWSKSEMSAYVKEYTVSLNNELAGKIACDINIKNTHLTMLTIDHPLLLPADHDDWVEQHEDTECSTRLHQLIGEQATIFCKKTNGALPRLDTIFDTSLTTESDLEAKIIHEALSEIFTAPLDNLLNFLEQSLCIGPLRKIPDSTYQPNQKATQEGWYDGTSCWDELSTPDLLRDPSINKWLTGHELLDLNYQLVYSVHDQVNRYVLPELKSNEDQESALYNALALHDAVGRPMRMTVSKENIQKSPTAAQIEIGQDKLEELGKFADNNPSKLYIHRAKNKIRKTILWDCRNHIPVDSSDIGVGVSQLLPLIVASQDRQVTGLIACEQPELHIHPRVQVAIGDLLTQPSSTRTKLSLRRKQYLIETHSEHLILRVLRRIRETSDNELPSGMSPVQNNNVSIVYLEPTEEGVQVRKIDIDEHGDFVQRWPAGFFGERAEELF